MSMTDIGREAGLRWKALTAPEKAVYEERAVADKDRYVQYSEVQYSGVDCVHWLVGWLPARESGLNSLATRHIILTLTLYPSATGIRSKWQNTKLDKQAAEMMVGTVLMKTRLLITTINSIRLIAFKV
jgi:hypothetical protein